MQFHLRHKCKEWSFYICNNVSDNPNLCSNNNAANYLKLLNMFVLSVVSHSSCISACWWRECSSYRCAIALGQHDHGHTRRTGIGHRTSKQWADEENSSWKERKFHQQRHVEEHHGTGHLPVPCDLVSAGWREMALWNRGRQLRSSLEHNHLQLLRILPGKLEVILAFIFLLLPNI